MTGEYLNRIEQFRNHGGDPSEEQGSAAPLHFGSIPLDFHEGPSLPFDVLHDPGRIYILYCGQEDGVDSPDLFQLAYILFYRARLGGEVFVGCKLGRVDEDRYDRLVVRLFRVVNEAEMSRMQGTHRGHKSNRFVVVLKLTPPSSTTC